MSFGALVDELLTRKEPNVFMVTNYPPPQIRKVLETINEWNDKTILKAYREISKTKKKDNTLLDDVYPYKAFYEALSEEKMLVDVKDYDKAKRLSDAVKMRYAHIFERPLFDVHMQTAVVWEHKGWMLKGLIDILESDGDRYNIYDIKTYTGNNLDNIRRYRYDLQLAFYKEGVEKVFRTDDIAAYILWINTDTGETFLQEIDDLTLQVGKFGIKQPVEVYVGGEKYIRLYTTPGFMDVFNTTQNTDNVWSLMQP